MNTSDLAENDPQQAGSQPADARPFDAAGGRGTADAPTNQSRESGEVEANDPIAKELSMLRDELQDAQDRALRAQAELENYRKRARRELEDERRYAHLPLIRDLLGVLDDLHRALDAAQQHEATAGLRDGVKIVAEHLAQVLEKYQAQPIEDLGTVFDPNLHEAIGQEPSKQYEAGVVSRVLRPGYRLHDRVVRPSQVMISRGPE
jgi:molecular chaperone GrpE